MQVGTFWTRGTQSRFTTEDFSLVHVFHHHRGIVGDLVLQGLLQTTTLYCLLFATFLTEREEETNKETTKDREEEEEGKRE